MMKRIFTLLAVIVVAAQAVRGANPERFFGMFYDKPGFEYNYISPQMIKTQGGEMLGDSLAAKLRLVEMVATSKGGRGKDFRKAISNAIERNGMELMSTQDNERQRNDFYAVWDDERGVCTHILLMKYADPGHYSTQLMYLVGNLTLDDIKTISTMFR